MLYHVVAMAKNRVIGKNNQLPWHFSEDLKHFKNLTTNSTVIMGRKTFESIGKPLPNRVNFVLTRSKFNQSEPPPKDDKVQAGNLRFFDSFEKAVQQVTTPEAYIIGGANLYEQTIEKVQGIYLTHIEADYEGDAFYPEIPSTFNEKSRHLLAENPRLEVIFYENTRNEVFFPALHGTS